MEVDGAKATAQKGNTVQVEPVESRSKSGKESHGFKQNTLTL